jgi:hypothetical protein
MLPVDASIEAAKIQLRSKDEWHRLEALEILYDAWSKIVAGIVLRKCPGLTSDRVISAVNDAFLGLYEYSGRVANRKMSIEAVLVWTASLRAIEQVRSQTKCGKLQAASGKVTEEVLNHLELGLELWTSADSAQYAEVNAALCDSIAKMEGQQREVAQLMAVYSDGFFLSAKDLHRLLKESGKQMTHQMVKRARQEVINKLRKIYIRFNGKPE